MEVRHRRPGTPVGIVEASDCETPPPPSRPSLDSQRSCLSDTPLTSRIPARRTKVNFAELRISTGNESPLLTKSEKATPSEANHDVGSDPLLSSASQSRRASAEQQQQQQQSQSQQAQQSPLPKLSRQTLFAFVWEEITKGYSVQNDYSRYAEKRHRVYAFIRVPLELEKFLTYGWLQCLDAFCNIFTFMPIRFLLSLVGLLIPGATGRRWRSAQTCDALRIAIIVVATWCMQIVDPSVVYHQVRGQGIIKLYILYNILEVFDKLFSSLGQDVLETLFLTASEKRGLARIYRTAAHFLFATVYAYAHTVLVLLQASTLLVAFNSHNQSLIVIMMSNNFVELKGAVFKKSAKPNLFQMACSDVRERFHIMVLLTVVVLRNMMAMNWAFVHFQEMLPDLAIVIGAELVVDWLKHAFITKFNEISADVYKDFTITIAYDVIRTRQASSHTDYTDQVSRRMGFIPIPLAIMLIRVCSQTFSLNTQGSLLAFLLFWMIMFLVKVLSSITLLGLACRHVHAYRELQRQAAQSEAIRRRMLTTKSKSAPSSPRISLIDFTDVLHQAAGSNGFTASDLMFMSQLEELAYAQANDAPSPGIAPQPPPTSSAVTATMQHNPVTGAGSSCAATTVGGAAQPGGLTPRRTQSLADLARPKRDKSLPPPIPITEEEGGVLPTGGAGASISRGMSADSETGGGVASPNAVAPTVSSESRQLSPKRVNPSTAVAANLVGASTPPDDLNAVEAYRLLDGQVEPRIE